jgi:protein CpxP
MKRYWIVLTLLTTSAGVSQILPAGLGSRWWRSPQMIERLGLTAEQRRKMDDVFQQSRLKLIDLTASLDKEEAMLEPLVAAEQADAAKIRSQIDRVAQARADLEKANANMLLELRLLLTQGQWKSLQDGGHGPRARRMTDGMQDLSPTPMSPTPRKAR